MNRLSLLTIAAFGFAIASAPAYEIKGGKPVAKFDEQLAKAKTEKKLVTVVYKGSDDNCPHCATAAENGVKAVHNSSVMVIVTERESRDPAVTAKLPQTIQDLLSKQTLGAWVSFTVYDPELTKVVASGDRSSLETDPKAIKEFASKVRDARKEIK